MKRLLTLDTPQRETMRAQLVSTAEQLREAEMTRLLETSAFFAQLWHGATFLVVDRTGNPDTADIKAFLTDGKLVDLWELNPILWDDAHWAAIRLVAVGQSIMVHPVLHKD